MKPMSTPRMAAWLESAWLARYLDRGLDPDEARWFEAYLLDRPELLAAVDADATLRAVLAGDRAAFERSGTDTVASGMERAHAPARRWPRWAALAASLAIGVGVGQLVLRAPAPVGGGVIANPERFVFDTLRGVSAPPLVQHGDSAAEYLYVEVAVPPTAADIELQQGTHRERLLASAEGFVSFLVDRRTLAAGTPLAIAYTLDGQPQHQPLDFEQRTEQR